MKKKKTKIEKDVEKLEEMIDSLVKAKTKTLVRAKRAEYWIKDTQEEYEQVVEDYNRSKNRLQDAFFVRRLPLWARIIPEIILFIKNPMKYIRYRSGTTKRMTKIYWSFKKIKKEWENDFYYTEQIIDKDFAYVEECEAFIKKQKELLETGYKIISKTTGARYK